MDDDKAQSLKAAKNSIKEQIRFLQSLLKHIQSKKEPHLSRAVISAWCLDQYMNDGFIKDIENTITRMSVNMSIKKGMM
jgi:hypothetical protein